MRSLLVVAPSLLFGLIFAFIFSRQLKSPRERNLEQKIAVFESELEGINKESELAHKVLDVLQKKDEDLYRVLLYADEFPEELRMMGTGGSDRYEALREMTNSELLVSTKDNLDRLEKRLYAQSLSFKDLISLTKNKEKVLASIPAIQPVRNSDLKRLASGYGWRIDPVYKTSKFHSGMDFTADVGTDVYCTGDGVIEELERSGWGYGNCIIVNHGFGYKTRYAHLSAFKVKKGDKVKRGDLIGLVGSTGKSTGPHLHYEVEKGGKKVNPIHYYHSDLTPDQYEKLLKMSESSFKSLD